MANEKPKDEPKKPEPPKDDEPPIRPTIGPDGFGIGIGIGGGLTIDPTDGSIGIGGIDLW